EADGACLARDGVGQRRRGSLPAQESRELLYSLLTDDDLAVRLEALRSLNALRSKESIPHLIRLLEVETGRLRGDARSALARLVGRDLGLVPGPWQRLWDREGAALRLPSEEEALRLLAEAENPRAEGSRALFYGIRIDSERLTFVVDTSGSMLEKAYTKETRLQVAQRELTGAIESLANGALFHVIAFAEVPRPLSESPSTASDRTRARMIEAVGRLRAGGGTNVYRALQEAFAVDGIDTVYLVSDGDPTVGRLVDIEALRREVGRWNSTRGLVLHCVAVGQPHELLQNLARDHGGTYRIVQ
ncbi:MAG: VWA domain-containing protein, partial [Planctomycetota bacterium]